MDGGKQITSQYVVVKLNEKCTCSICHGIKYGIKPHGCVANLYDSYIQEVVSFLHKNVSPNPLTSKR